jgi:acylphosphatase
MKKSAQIIVNGDVQGIGYRFFIRQSAGPLGLNGWVRNNLDGTVECEVEGEKGAIEEFVMVLKEKHHWARVNSIDVTWNDYNGKYSNFIIK